MNPRTARRAALVASLALHLAPRTLHAGGGPATDSYDDLHDAGEWLDARALLDVYALYNGNHPASGTNTLRQFDTAADRASLGYLRLTLAHRPRTLGFRVDVGLGDTADAFYREDPAFSTHPTEARALSFVQQAFVTLVVPLGTGVFVDVGKFGTPVGFEDNETVTNWNYSRGLLYAWAEPSLHTGARVSYAFDTHFSAALFWVNGWNTNFADGNGMGSLALGARWAPRDNVSAVLVWMGGPERAPQALGSPALAYRNVVSAYATFAPIRPLTLALTFDAGHDGDDRGPSWWGVGGYARWKAREWLATAVRCEVLADPDGYLTGTRQSVAEVTATIEVARTVSLSRWSARLEVRHDQSSARPFETATPVPRASQDTLTLALAAQF